MRILGPRNPWSVSTENFSTECLKTSFHVMKKNICRPMDKSLRFDWFDTLRIDLLDDLSSKVALVIDLDKNTKNQSPEQLKNQKIKT